jgi:hypothetical protein
MSHPLQPTQYRLAQIALAVGGKFGFALAGGHAIAAHGILDRPSEDVDLFTDWHRRADFPAAVDEVIAAYQALGYEVRIDHRLDTFARLYVIEPEVPALPHRVELVANWRAQPPVQMEIGPVLHPDDVMAGKVDALYNRAAARDFLDLDAAIASRRYTLQGLCELARIADAGFDVELFAGMLRHIERFDDQEFAAYGLSAADVAQLRMRVAAWRTELLSPDGPL